jgi:hypothetical protein
MSDNFEVELRVKPYVRQYLINNCGSPVELSHLPKFRMLFRRLITKPLFRFESLASAKDYCYVRVKISSDTFYRHGWEMTETSMRYFNAEVERELKFLMRTWIGNRAGLGYPVAQCIRDFQDRFKMPEEVWSFDAIKKDLDRNTETKKDRDVETFLEEIDRKMQSIFLENLSAIGTISNKYKNELSEIK